MQLILLELMSSLISQQLAAQKVQQVYAVRPHIVKYGTPTGTMTVQLLDSYGNVKAQSAALNMNQLPQSSTYWHGYQTFLVNSALKSSEIFSVGLQAGGGYTFSESNYVGWCNGYDLGKYAQTYTIVPNNAALAPLDLEIWGYSEAKRGF